MKSFKTNVKSNFAALKKTKNSVGSDTMALQKTAQQVLVRSFRRRDYVQQKLMYKRGLWLGEVYVQERFMSPCPPSELG